MYSVLETLGPSNGWNRRLYESELKTIYDGRKEIDLYLQVLSLPLRDHS